VDGARSQTDVGDRRRAIEVGVEEQREPGDADAERRAAEPLERQRRRHDGTVGGVLSGPPTPIPPTPIPPTYVLTEGRAHRGPGIRRYGLRDSPPLPVSRRPKQ